MSDTSKNPPVAKTPRIGNVRANIWARQTEKTTFYAATLERGYKDKDGKWKSTDSLDSSDIQNARKALDLAQDIILKLQAADAEIQANTGEGA